MATNPFMVNKAAASIDPVIIIGSQEAYSKFTHFMRKAFYVIRNLTGKQRECWPPP